MKNIKTALEEFTEQQRDGRELLPSLGGNVDEFLMQSANRHKGNLDAADGIHCPKCNDDGFIINSFTNGTPNVKVCECRSKRAVVEKMNKSGLGDALQRCRFDNYMTHLPWQKSILAKAEQFVADKPLKWFIICGNSGSGKTHICAAISKALIENDNMNLRYICWYEDVKRLKGESKDDARAYEKHIAEIKTAQALYIDDFLKTGSNQPPTAADVGIAFDIINHRYMNHLVTIVSSERSIQDILTIDESLGSRIYEKTAQYGYCIDIPKGQGKNHRLITNREV